MNQTQKELKRHVFRFPDALPDTIRAFVAIRPDELVVDAIEEFIGELRTLGADAVWVKRPNIHITLRFLGNRVETERVKHLCTRLAELSSKLAPFEVNIAGVGAFPNLERPRVLWCGVESRELTKLAEEVEKCTREVGFVPADRAFAPHLTLARVKSLKRFRPTAERLAEASKREFGKFMVASITVFRSELLPAGARHSEFFVVELTG